MVGRIGGRISVMIEWLWVNKYWTAFCDSFRQKQGAQAQEGTVQRKTAKEMVSDCIKIRCTVDL